MSNVLIGLNKEQKNAVEHKDGPLLIVAGAGTGKTTVVTRRIAHLIERGVKPEKILAMAFGEKAASEMEERVDQLLPIGYYNLQISTFHSFGERLLKEFGLAIGLPDFRVLDEAGQWLLVRNNLESFELDYYRPMGSPTWLIRSLTSHFSRCKDELITPEEYLAYAEQLKLQKDRGEAGDGYDRDEAGRLSEIANAYHVYNRLLLKNGYLDFGDLISYPLQLLRKRPQILAQLQKRYQHLLIDEFQDTNYAQYELIKLLAAPTNNLTVVGDDDQSIFKFRGASISNIMHFQKDYKDAKFISLTKNYRSSQKILDISHKFIRQNDPDRLEVKLQIDKHLKSQTKKAGLVRVLETPDSAAEAAAVIETIKGTGKKIDWNDYAILARSHEALVPFLNELEAHQVPHIYVASRGLYRKPIVLDILAYFKIMLNHHDNASFYRAAKLDIFSIKHSELVDLIQYAKKKTLSLYEGAQKFKGFSEMLSSLDKHSKDIRDRTVGEIFVRVVNDLRLNSVGRAGEAKQLDNARFLEAFNRKVRHFMDKSVDKTLSVFMEELLFEQEAGEQGHLVQDPDAGPEAVRLMTVHAAKGLEFKEVFIVGLVDKRFPSIERKEAIQIPVPLIKDLLPEGDAHLEEERRLMYVAMTRAKENLYLSRATDYGGKITKKPSRFLVELGLAKEEKPQPTGKTAFSPANQQIRLPVPKSFSYSQISAFRACPLQYKYRYVLKLPEAGSGALSFGNTIHNTFEKFLRHAKSMDQPDLFGENQKTQAPTIKTLEKLYEESWIDEWYENKMKKNEYYENGKRILRDFYADYLTTKPDPKYLEEWFRLPVKHGIFRGKIDRADETEKGLIIIDYKTGKSRKIDKVEKEQLLVYQWAAEEFFKEKVVDLQYWFLADKLEKVSFVGKPGEIETLKSEINDTVTEIIQATREDSFYERDLRANHRRECAYRDLET